MTVFSVQVTFIHSSCRYYSFIHPTGTIHPFIHPSYSLNIPFIHFFFMKPALFIHSSYRYYSSFHLFIHLTSCIHHLIACIHHSFILFWNMHYSFIPPTGTFHLSSFLSSFHSFINLTACIYHSFIYFFMKHALFIHSSYRLFIISFIQSPFTPFLSYRWYSLIPYRRNHLVIYSII